MKNLCFAFLFFSISIVAAGQKLSIEPTAGFAFTTGSEKNQSKIQAGVIIWMNPVETISLGLHLSTGGTIWKPDNSLDGTTEIIPSANFNYNLLLLKARYFFLTSERVRLFVGGGLGSNKYFFDVNAEETERVEHRNFAWILESGIRIHRFSITASFTKTGKTPDFEGFQQSEYGGNPLKLDSEDFGLAGIMFGYAIPIFTKKP